ncbi:hypothetical protein SNOD_34460 [Streptomyces nodosus]|uniref:Uncharacterized protein n=1 Tax=Streptomyces nodosus TaxID=40318 RepID=A0A0B5DW96_9ACTN|nr:hypothetical protein SNOD_00050 [Streptomyces nodosus]AJE44507.1 hypothetical protein SNOD_34460 [Streptomyces nodosus]
MGAVSAQASEDVHVGAVVDLGARVCGQDQSGQLQGMRCGGRREQRRWTQRPVGGAAAWSAAGGLVQDRGVKQPYLQAGRPEIGHLQPAAVSQFLPHFFSPAQSHAAQQPCRQMYLTAGVGPQGALQGQQPAGG